MLGRPGVHGWFLEGSVASVSVYAGFACVPVGNSCSAWLQAILACQAAGSSNPQQIKLHEIQNRVPMSGALLC